jgi:hypothetical protein
MGGLIRNPKMPAPTRFQNATPTKNVIGQRIFRTQGRVLQRQVWKASSPISTSGTTSSALNVAPMAMIETGVPLKYR